MYRKLAEHVMPDRLPLRAVGSARIHGTPHSNCVGTAYGGTARARPAGCTGTRGSSRRYLRTICTRRRRPDQRPALGDAVSRLRRLEDECRA